MESTAETANRLDDALRTDFEDLVLDKLFKENGNESPAYKIAMKVFRLAIGQDKPLIEPVAEVKPNLPLKNDEWVVQINGVDEYGPQLLWNKHWVDYPVGTRFYRQSAPTVDDTPTLDLDAIAWDGIKKAASESTWMPKEYTGNDWQSDVESFLRDGPKVFKQASLIGMTIDQLPADEAALEFLDNLADEARKATPHVEIRWYNHETDGRTGALWVDNSLVATAVVLRNDMNHSLIVTHQY